MYTEKVMDHFMRTRAMWARLITPDGVGDGRQRQVRRHHDASSWISTRTRSSRDAKFKTFGCGAAIATSSSMATEMIIGKSVRGGAGGHQQGG